MLAKDFLPAVSAYAGDVAKNAASKKAFLPSVSTASEETLVCSLSDAYEVLSSGLGSITEVLAQIREKSETSMQDAANTCLNEMLPLMDTLRKTADEAEAKIPEGYLPYPTYDQLLFSV